MLDIGDIEAAFVVWRAAGLTPPPMNDVQRENFMAKTLEQYKYTHRVLLHSHSHIHFPA